jgi:hypothetical protein
MHFDSNKSAQKEDAFKIELVKTTMIAPKEEINKYENLMKFVNNKHK